MPHILLVDDDVELCAMLAEYLVPEGFDVSLAHDGESGSKMALEGAYDAVVLDVMMPRLNGFDALRRIRSESRIAVLMLTAKGDDIDRIVGLEMGADDYLPKPCNPRELLARLRAILRRTETGVDHADEKTPEVIVVGDVEIHPSARTALRSGVKLDLTSTEYTVLEVLIREAGKVVAKEDLSRQALGRKLAMHDRGLDMHISKVRRKLSRPGDSTPLIETVRGVGYQFIRK